jgi:hypothetical protein
LRLALHTDDRVALCKGRETAQPLELLNAPLAVSNRSINRADLELLCVHGTMGERENIFMPDQGAAPPFASCTRSPASLSSASGYRHPRGVFSAHRRRSSCSSWAQPRALHFVVDLSPIYAHPGAAVEGT